MHDILMVFTLKCCGAHAQYLQSDLQLLGGLDEKLQAVLHHAGSGTGRGGQCPME